MRKRLHATNTHGQAGHRMDRAWRHTVQRLEWHSSASACDVGLVGLRVFREGEVALGLSYHGGPNHLLAAAGTYLPMAHHQS